MIGDALTLTAYFGDDLTAGPALAGDALMRRLAERGVRAAALVRGIEGFGINRRIRSARLPDLSADLPLLATAVDDRAAIAALVGDVDRVLSRGLVTLEHTTLASGDDVAAATVPAGPGASARITVRCGQGERAGRRPAHREAIDVLRRSGAAGAVALLGVDGVIAGRRAKARPLARNRETPMVIVAVGTARSVERSLPQVRDCVRHPVVTLERISLLKHDGRSLGTPAGTGGDRYHALGVFSRRSALVDGQPLHRALARAIRAAGGAGITTVAGEWGFVSAEAPYGDRLGRAASHAPTWTVAIDRPPALAALWPLVDELTAEHGLVTHHAVAGYRERAGDATHGDLGLARDAASAP